MTATSDTVFADGLDYFDQIASSLEPADWDRPSPCDGWTALDVLGHLGTALNMGASVLQGEQPTWPTFGRPAELVDGEPLAFYRSAADRCRSALQGADLETEMDTPMGPRTVADRLAFPAIDLYVHGWDVATTVGESAEIPQSVIDFAHVHLDPIPPEMMRGERGVFGPEVEPPADASSTDAFVAWTGRQPRGR